jgi:hypothetical protein
MQNVVPLKKICLVAALATLTLSAIAAPEALAQAASKTSINAGRDCQTVLRCNYRRNGRYRGCISAYSCRICRPVRAPRCRVGSRTRTCSQIVCSW